MRGLAVLAIALAAPAATAADVILAARTIPANSVIASQDIVVKPGDIAGVAALPADVIGKETRVAVYAGRPLRLADIGPPAVIERNQIVPLIYEQAGLRIVAEGRSLSRAGAGERVRVMNLSSRSTVTGRSPPGLARRRHGPERPRRLRRGSADTQPPLGRLLSSQGAGGTQAKRRAPRSALTLRSTLEASDRVRYGP